MPARPGSQKPILGNFGVPKLVNVSRFYDQHVAKMLCFRESKLWSGLDTNQLKSFKQFLTVLILKTAEHERILCYSSRSFYFFEVLLLFYSMLFIYIF